MFFFVRGAVAVSMWSIGTVVNRDGGQSKRGQYQRCSSQRGQSGLWSILTWPNGCHPLIPVIDAYRSTSRDALCVVADATAVEILLQEGRARYEAKKGLDVEIGQEIVCSGSKDAMERIKAKGRRL